MIERMYQRNLFVTEKTRPVNVAAIPQLSPFRYPGGKTWLIPWIRVWLDKLPYKPSILVEPFAGGAIVGLTSVVENYVDRALLIEIDPEIAAVWKTILSKNNRWLADKILNFSLTFENAEAIINSKLTSSREIAFKTILKNRIYHGGILAAGSGMLKNGENGKGIHSRWYPKTLVKRIRNIYTYRHKISFEQSDGLEVIGRFKYADDAVFFIDPPYTASRKRAGQRLYKYSQIDHDRLFAICSEIQGKFLMTYDDSAEVKDLVTKYNFESRLVPMKNTHHREMFELLISNDMAWFS